MRITDLHQGIVWGTQTEETKLDEGLINRFDYDGDYGTVLNRFLNSSGPSLLEVKIGTGSFKNLLRIENLRKIKKHFMN